MSATLTPEEHMTTPDQATPQLLKGKKIVIFGVANKWSIAWGITQTLSEAGAQLALNYMDDRTEEKVRDLSKSLKTPPLLFPCDVSSDEQIAQAFDLIKKEFGQLDGLVHAVAFAKREELEGSFLKTTREGFRIAMDISAFSLVALATAAAPLMEGTGGSIITLSYIGGKRVIPNYNVMGVAKSALETCVKYLANDLGPRNIRVNCISAGPINTLAARGISGFQKLLSNHQEKTPLRRNMEPDDIGDTALYLCSSLARGVTGETIYVDAGYHILGA